MNRIGEAPAVQAVATLSAPWRAPAAVAAAFAHEPFSLLLLSGGASGRWSYLMRAPEQVLTVRPDDAGDPWATAAVLLPGGGERAAEGPPFQGGLAGLAAYELGARQEPTVPQDRLAGWPDFAAGLYLALLAFDHETRQVVAVGRGADRSAAEGRARAALAWLDAGAAPVSEGVLAAEFAALGADADYEAAVARTVAAIAEGEIFQANLARAWGGRLAPAVQPFDIMARLAGESPAPFAAYLRLPGLAVVSNSPERFLSVDPDGWVRGQPIKGTRPRGADPVQDAALAAELLASQKDRAENLMIVDLMRWDPLESTCRHASLSIL